MDTRTGNIYSPEQMAAMMAGRELLNDTAKASLDQQMRRCKLVEIEPTPEQVKRGRIARNDPCPCGSGKKFKRCCLDRS